MITILHILFHKNDVPCSTLLFKFTSILCFSSQLNINVVFNFSYHFHSVNFNLPSAYVDYTDISLLLPVLLLSVLTVAYISFIIYPHVVQLLAEVATTGFSLQWENWPLLVFMIPCFLGCSLPNLLASVTHIPLPYTLNSLSI